MNLKDISIKYNLPEASVRKIYNKYLRLILEKSKKHFEELRNMPILDKKTMYYDKSGKFTFYLRYLGKFYLNYNHYIKKKNHGYKRNTGN